MLKRGQTPSQTVGPFFHYGLIENGDENILVTDATTGQRIILKGQVTDGNGDPIGDALLEIWQADSMGFFNHPADPNHVLADPSFRGFGRAPTNDDGIYTFKTIKPGGIPYDDNQDQAPHINVRIFARGMLIHAYTRVYFSDEPDKNVDDVVLNLVPEERRSNLIAPKEEFGDLPTYCFNISLQGDNETPFFEP